MNTIDTMSKAVAGPERDEIDLTQILANLWRGKWLILSLMVLGMVIGGYYSLRVATPMYPATATVALEPQQQPVIADIESIFAGGGADLLTINTEIEIYRSRRLIGQLVDELDLVSDPEFNSELREPGWLSRLIGSLRGGAAEPPTDDAIRRRVIDGVIDRISVANVRQSLAFNISTVSQDPDKSALIVNTLADLYIIDQIQQKLEAASQAIEFLSVRTSELETNLEQLEQDLAQLNEQNSVLTPELLQARNLQLGELRDRMSDLMERIAIEAADVAMLRSATDFDALLAILQDADDGRLQAIFQRFRSNRITQAEAEAAVNEVIGELEQSQERARQQLEALRRSEADLAAQIRTQSDQLIAAQQLEREVEAARLLYETFFTRLQEASVQQGLETADARILSEAVPRPPSSPRLLLNVAFMGLLGAIIGSVWVILRELRFAGFRTSDELRAATGHSVLGSIPSLPVKQRKEMLAHMNAAATSVFAEAVRNLRTSIMMASVDREEPQVILMTSSIPGEGKTTVSIALARYFSSLEGRRTLLLEADLRRQTLRAYSDGKWGSSLVDMLLGRVSPEEAELYNEEFGMDVLAGSDGSSGNAADLFTSRRFRDLVEALRKDYDYIVIDSPPVLAVPDARVLANLADAVVFVVRWSHTTRTQVRLGLEMLHSIGRPPTGLVLSQIDQKQMKRYGYAGQYGYDDTSSAYYKA